MDCKELKIWLLSAEEGQLLSPSVEIREHLQICTMCSQKYETVKEATRILQAQKKAILPEFTSNVLINRLQQLAEKKKNTGISFQSKLAISAIVAGGLILGILAGNLYSRNIISNESALWDDEFASASENTVTNITFFE